MSSCDGISSCVFLKDGRLATTSFDGRIEVWDVGNGCRLEQGWKDSFKNTLECTNLQLQERLIMFELTRVPCRTALIDAHTNAITASDTSSDRKHLATVSLDSMLKVSLQISFSFAE